MIPARRRFFRLVAAVLIAAAFALTPVQREAAADTVSLTSAWSTPPPPSVMMPHDGDAITATASLTAVATVMQGQTSVVLPLQVTSGRALVATVQTLPHARVSFTVAYPDGTMRHIVHLATAAGTTEFVPVVSYQPQSAAETAAVTIAVYYNSRRRLGDPDDVVTRNVTVLQRIVLTGSLDVPPFVVVGTTLPLTVSANLPNVAVRVTLVYPDGAPQLKFSYTAADGTAPFSFTVSSSDGRRGVLRVSAVLDYGGAKRILRRMVRLRPPTGSGQ